MSIKKTLSQNQIAAGGLAATVAAFLGLRTIATKINKKIEERALRSSEDYYLVPSTYNDNARVTVEIIMEHRKKGLSVFRHKDYLTEVDSLPATLRAILESVVVHDTCCTRVFAARDVDGVLSTWSMVASNSKDSIEVWWSAATDFVFYIDKHPVSDSECLTVYRAILEQHLTERRAGIC